MPLPSNGTAVEIHGFCITEIGYGSLVCSIDENTGVKPRWLKRDKLFFYTKYKNLIVNSILKFLTRVMIKSNYSLLKVK